MTRTVEVGASVSPWLSVRGRRWPPWPQAPGPQGRRRPSPWVEKATALWLPESVCCVSVARALAAPSSRDTGHVSSSSRLSRGSGRNTGARDMCPCSASKLGEAPKVCEGHPQTHCLLVGAPHVGLGSHVLSFSNHLSLGLILNVYIFLESCLFHWSAKMCGSSCTR